MTAPNPLDDFHGIGFTRGTNNFFSIEVFRDLRIGQGASQIADPIDNRSWISYLVGNAGRQRHREIAVGAALPTDVNRELLFMGWSDDGNVLNEQPQHTLTILRLSGCGVP